MESDRAMQISATVIRADGTIEELGVIAEGDLEFAADGAPEDDSEEA